MTSREYAKKLVVEYLNLQEFFDMNIEFAKHCAFIAINEQKKMAGKYYNEVRVKGVIGIEGYFQDELEFLNEVEISVFPKYEYPLK